MRTGIVSYWFNRGQATVGRHLRSALESLGHETFVLARPTQKNFVYPDFIDERDIWNQPNVTTASAFHIPTDEYLDWARQNRLEAVFCFQNYQFEQIAELKKQGIATIGCFMWESFAPEHVDAAKQAYTKIYSLTLADHNKYKAMGLDTHYVRWGCHPENLAFANTPKTPKLSFFYPGGFLSSRKSTLAVIEAFKSAELENAQLIIKTQRPMIVGDLLYIQSPKDLQRKFSTPEMSMRAKQSVEALAPGIQVVEQDLTDEQYCRLFASAHVCVCPSRWEGLGLHLFEALSFGMPIVCNNMQPLDEVAKHGINATLFDCFKVGQHPNKTDIMELDVASFKNALQAVAKPEIFQQLKRGTTLLQRQRNWQNTIDDFAALTKTL